MMADETYPACESDSADLTDYERELLVCIMEECAEIIQAASKVFRFGKTGWSRNPVPNTVILSGEIGDLVEVLNRAAKVTLIDFTDIADSSMKKRAKMDVYLQHGPTAIRDDEAEEKS